MGEEDLVEEDLAEKALRVVARTCYPKPRVLWHGSSDLLVVERQLSVVCSSLRQVCKESTVKAINAAWASRRAHETADSRAEDYPD